MNHAIVPALLLLTACAATHDPGVADAPAPIPVMPPPDAGEPIREPPDPGPVCATDEPEYPASLLLREWGHCDGQIAANAEASTPWREHPQSGQCTFTCAWSDSNCSLQRPTDSRCGADYAAKLATLCEQLGGECAPGRYREGAKEVMFCVPRRVCLSPE